MMNSLTGDAFVFAIQKFPITEINKDEDFIGLRLFMGLKAKYDIALIRSEVFQKKQDIFNFQLRGNVTNFLKEITNTRHFLLSHSKMSDGQITLFDEDILQSILAKLSDSYNAFVIATRAVEVYTMTFSEFTNRIENEEREMNVQRNHHPHQEQANFSGKGKNQDQVSSMKNGGKWSKKKEKKGKSKSIEGSNIDSSKLFNSNPNSIKTSNYSPFQTRSHRTNFMLDSGATSHFVSDKKLLTNFIKDKISINLANNSKTSGEGYGNMYWKTLDKNSGKEITIKLKKVYFVDPSYIKAYYLYQLFSSNFLKHQKFIAIRKT